jgi:hypothetical protein
MCPATIELQAKSYICRYVARWVDENEVLLDLGAGYGDFSTFTSPREKWLAHAFTQGRGSIGAFPWRSKPPKRDSQYASGDDVDQQALSQARMYWR